MTNQPFTIPAQSAAPSLIDGITDWLMMQTLSNTRPENIIEGLCERLVAAGTPIFRVHIAFSVLHPLLAGMGVTWLRESRRERFIKHDIVSGEVSRTYVKDHGALPAEQHRMDSACCAS